MSKHRLENVLPSTHVDFHSEIAGRVEGAYRDDRLGHRDKQRYFLQLLQFVFIEWCEDEQFPFHTFFSRVAYIGSRYDFPPDTLYLIHHFRKLCEGAESTDQELATDAGAAAILSALEARYHGVSGSDLLHSLRIGEILSKRKEAAVSYRGNLRAYVIRVDPDGYTLDVMLEEAPDRIQKVQFNREGRNEIFNRNLRQLDRFFGMPVAVTLIQTEVEADGLLSPAALVIRPDFLVDVTAIAECFQYFGSFPASHLIHKFLPRDSSVHILTGHTVNYLLDRLVQDPEVELKDCLPEIFRLDPLAFSLLSDNDMVLAFRKIRSHFENLRRVVRHRFPDLGIELADCMLEPSFYNPQYGIQGRLDLFARKKGKEKAAIIELKSGKPFRPNAYGLNRNHYTQTILYHLMVQAAYGRDIKPMSYILYSSQPDNPLRYAPFTRASTMEAIEMRNQIVVQEELLRQSGAGNPSILERLHPSDFPDVSGFLKADLVRLHQAFSALSGLEKEYIRSYIGFLGREYHLAKIGNHQLEERNGFASFWLDNQAEKEEKFCLLRDLRVRENHAGDDDAILVLGRSPGTNPLAKFRVGDIVILYPAGEGNRVDPHARIHKSSIIAMDRETVTIRLRSAQKDPSAFDAPGLWNLERDFLDSSYTAQFRAFYQFASARAGKRKLWLGLRPPARPDTSASSAADAGSTDALPDRMLASPDYFLLWGPPGTGKTSVVIRGLIERLHEETGERILLLSYTNRAVDEICGVLDQLALTDRYIRIGSRYATGQAHRARLLRILAGSVDTRSGLRELIRSHRIFVSTVSSLLGKPELLQLVKFDRLIIDEASQIPEPALIGLLPHFDHAILVGDHRQLPAVVQQSPAQTKVRPGPLREAGFTDLANSLFERLYLQCRRNGWDWAFAQLHHQGRMHRDICRFVSDTFYEGRLSILSDLPHITGRLTRPLPELFPDIRQPDDDYLGKRIVFIPTEAEDPFAARKINHHEARGVVSLLSRLLRTFHRNRMPVHEDSIGIITPFRAQIALIRSMIQEEGLPHQEEIGIDTVERYQGGARDIIILSLVTNSVDGLRSISSLSDEGVDRKLNVALTRAREMIFLLGNEEILRTSAVYRGLLDYIEGLKIKD